MNAPIPPVAPCACTALRKASRAISRLYEDRFVQTGLTITQFSLLRALDRRGDQPLSRLAEAMVMDRTSLYRLIAPLERDRLVTIATRAGRVRLASLTYAGRQAIEQAAPVWDATQAEFLERFGRRQWSDLADVLARVVAVASRGAGE